MVKAVEERQSSSSPSSSSATLMCPSIGGMPINESTTDSYFTCKFPTLFPTGAADFSCFPHSSPLVLLISHVKEDRIKSPSSINTSQPCISDQCLPVCTIVHYYTLHYGLIILAMVYSMAPSGPFNVACTIIIQTIYLATTVYLALHSIIYIMPCCHDNHNTVIELAMQRRAGRVQLGRPKSHAVTQVTFASLARCSASV